MNGIEPSIHIRQLYPDCKVVLSSGQIVTSELLNAAHLQGHHFAILAKPVHPEEPSAREYLDVCDGDQSQKSKGPEKDLLRTWYRDLASNQERKLHLLIFRQLTE
jgi:CheY-like chemotaxis protein